MLVSMPVKAAPRHLSLNPLEALKIHQRPGRCRPMLTVATNIFKTEKQNGTHCKAACSTNHAATRKLLESCVLCLSLAERSGQPRGCARDRTCRAAEFACRARDQEAAEGAKRNEEKHFPTVPKICVAIVEVIMVNDNVSEGSALCACLVPSSHCVSCMKSSVTEHQVVARMDAGQAPETDRQK